MDVPCQTRRATQWAVLVLLLALALLAVACDSQPAADPPRPPSPVADCYRGTGVTPAGERLVGTLRLTADGPRVTGLYVVGLAEGQGLAYDVAGTLTGGRFTGAFTYAGQAVTATGSISRDAVVLDGGRGFSITRFAAGCAD